LKEIKIAYRKRNAISHYYQKYIRKKENKYLKKLIINWIMTGIIEGIINKYL